MKNAVAAIASMEVLVRTEPVSVRRDLEEIFASMVSKESENYNNISELRLDVL